MSRRSSPFARLLLAWTLALFSAGQVAARDVPFNGGWRFIRIDDRTVPAAPPADARWDMVTLPHTTRIESRVVDNQWQGIAFYEKRFNAPGAWRAKTVLLRFEAAMNVAEVSLNGRLIARHQGGYLPFTVDLSPHLAHGRTNRLLVRLDNRDNVVTGPRPLRELDFNSYGGLYRGVRLMVKPAVHLTDEMLAGRIAGGGLFVTYPEATRERVVVSIAADIGNAGRGTARAQVMHELYLGERKVGEAHGALTPAGSVTERSQLRIVLDNPALWSPRHPNLYRLVTTVSSGEGDIDRAETRIGIRRIAIDKTGFSINGERMFLHGVNRHQEYPYIGYALSPQADYRDAKRIKEAGFDYVRLSHYPHSPAFMAAADELGLVLLDAIPGWQYFNPGPAFRAQAIDTCRDMIRRDRNHPSVIAWECSLNETRMPEDLVRQFDRVVHQEYPGDQAWSAGWQKNGFDIFLQARQHRLQHYEEPGRPYVVSEYGDWEYYDQNAGINQHGWSTLKAGDRSSRQTLGSGEARLLQQATNVQEAHNDNLRVPAFADAYWVMFDYNRGDADDLETSGVMSIERLPKFAYWFFRSQRDAEERSPLFDGGPMVHIASHWQKGSGPTVRVFTNAEQVELFLNGRSLGKKTPARDALSDRLRHPPLRFAAGRFQPGMLLAVAYIGGREVARHSVATAGPAARLRVSIDDAGVPPGADDYVFARAEIIDANGNRVFAASNDIAFEAHGDFAIVGSARSSAEEGYATVLVKVLKVDPTGSVAAAGAGLGDGRATFRTPSAPRAR